MITSIEQTNDQPWTVEEDEKLLKMLRRCPDKNKWSIVSKGVGTHPLKAFIETKIDYQPRSQEPDKYTGAKPSYPHTITLRDFMDKYPHTISWQELETRLPDVLTAINGDKMTSFSYDKAETFYVCDGCKHYIQKNKNSAAAEVFCCEAFEEKRGDDNYDLKKACVLFDSGKSAGKPRKFMTTDRDGRKKTMAADGIEGPEKVDAACIRNAIWR